MIICDVVLTIALIKQALRVHKILYSFCEICNITKRKGIRKTCIEFYLYLRGSIQTECRRIFIELMQNYPEQITAQKDGIEILMRRFPLTTQHSGNSWTILREESLTRVQILHCLGGHAPPPQRRRYVDSSAQILRIVDDYPNREPIYYLQSIVHNLSC